MIIGTVQALRSYKPDVLELGGAPLLNRTVLDIHPIQGNQHSRS